MSTEVTKGKKRLLLNEQTKKREVIMLPTSLHLKNSLLILPFPFVTIKVGITWRRGNNTTTESATSSL